MLRQHKTPQQIGEWLAANIHRFDLPELYVGDEPNTYGPWAKGKFFKDLDWFWNPENDKQVMKMVYAPPCDLVQVAGNQTLPLIYQLINDRHENFLCERSLYPPTRKDIKLLNQAGIPPFSLESKHCIFDFDVIGTTLAFPGFWPNLVKQYRDSGVPARWAERDKLEGVFPLVICGGQIFAQPGPIDPIVDAVVIGEAEDGRSGSDNDEIGFPTLMLDVIEAKKRGDWYTKSGRLDLLHHWASSHHWFYVPRFYEYKYRDPRTTKKHFVATVPIYEDIPVRPKRRWIYDINEIPCVTAPPINAHDPSMGLGEIEASRSCTGKCSFCAEIYRYAPYRERSVDYLVKAFTENKRNSGAINAFPTGFDFPCYSRKNELYTRLLEEVSDEVDTQSSRVDHFVEDTRWTYKAQQGGMKQLAVGIEGNSQRLRQIMSKGVTTETLLKSVEMAIQAGYEKVKFFMIADWAWETPLDTQEIIDVGRQIMEMKKHYNSNITVRFSWTPLLVEAWTPLQWERAVISANDRLSESGWQEAIDDKKLVGVYDQLKPLGIGFSLGKKTEQNYYYFMQAFHMADRLLAEVMLDVAEELDQVYCGSVDREWINTMHRHMSKIGLTWDHYFRRKDYDESFWWDFIDIDIPKDWFMDYSRKMHAMIEATDPSKPENVAKFGEGNALPQQEQLVQIGQSIAVTKELGDGKTRKLTVPKHLLQKGELVSNCDTGCSACMACETGKTVEGMNPSQGVIGTGKVDFYKDVMLPKYFKEGKTSDEQWKDRIPRILDETTIERKLHIKIKVDDNKRFMPNPYWIAGIRRAANLADVKVSKRSFKLASSVHGFKPYVAGAGYCEFGLLPDNEFNVVSDIVERMNENMPRGLKLDHGKFVGRDVDLLERRHEYVGLYHYVLDFDVKEADAAIKVLYADPDFEMSIKRDEYRKGISTVKLKVHDWLYNCWLIRQGHELILSILMKYGEATPYNVITSVFKKHLTEVHKTPLRLIEVMLPPVKQVDFFTNSCVDCGSPINLTILGEPFDSDRCPQCFDINNGALVTSPYAFSTQVSPTQIQ